MRRSAADTREHVLSVANTLFYQQGIRATGVDQVASEAGVAPTTLYRLFATKEDLVAAYVERSADSNRQWFEAAVRSADPDPRAQILGVFDALLRHVRTMDYRGCACMMSLAEYPDDASAVHVNAVAAKRWVRQRFHQLAIAYAADAGPGTDPAALADELTLVFEGVQAAASALGGRGPARRAGKLVERILDTATPT